LHIDSNNVHFIGVIEVSVEPNDLTVVEVGTVIHFNCMADGYQASMFTYQWKMNGSNILGATNKSLIISSTSNTESGMYQCCVTNHWGEMETSNTTELIVTSKLLSHAVYYFISCVVL